MYSAKINGEHTTFGTTGLLYRSNKLMYDRATNTVWHQLTGEPVIGPMAEGGARLSFFPVVLTTWREWRAEHPDTTVLSINTGVYLPESYLPESNPRAVYQDYFSDPATMFPVPNRSAALETKDVVLGLGIGDAYKAYPVEVLQREVVVNDELGGKEVVVVASPASQAARAYERQGRRFFPGAGSAVFGLPSVIDSSGSTWKVTEEYLISDADPSQKLRRLPAHMSFWFGWFSFHPDTEIYTGDAG